MSKFADKIRQGELPDADDWAEHLREAHAIAPSMTPHSYGLYRTADGKSSYGILADQVEPRPGARLVDLACGDGHLIPLLLAKLDSASRVAGVDMSPGELDVARRDLSDPRVYLHLATAQSLPLETGSVDHVLCHMAFMLMLPIEPVILELGRVLKPGGKFSAVIGSRADTGLFDEIRQTTFRYIDSRYPKVRESRSGDPRVSSAEGLSELFCAPGVFHPLEEIREFSLIARTAPEGIWDFMKNMYFVAMLPEHERLELRNELVSLGARQADPSGHVTFRLPMKCFTVTRK